MSTTMIKECPRHGMVEHILLENGVWKCKECRKDAVIDTRRRNKIRLVEYKGGKCEICGYNKCIDALEFHHLNPEEKDFGLSCGDTRSLERLKVEADKCIMVCANCHREIHAKEREEKQRKKEEIEEKRKILFYENNPILEDNYKKKLSKEKLNLEYILKDIDTNTPKRKIAEKYGVSVKIIKNFLKKNGIVYDETLNKSITSKIEVDDFVKQYKKYGAFTKLSEHYGVSDNAIRKWCCRKNIPWRKNEIEEFVKNYKVE